MKIKAVDYIMYNVSDLKKGIEFYKNVLGLKLDSSGEGWAEFDIGGMALVLGSWGYDAKLKGNGNGVALAVDDVDAALSELKKKGVTIEGEPWKTPVCVGAAISDPDGNKIYLHKRNDGTCG